MKVVGTFQPCLARQVNGGVRIKRSRAQLMNSKGQLHQHLVVRVVPIRGLKMNQGRYLEAEDRGRAGMERDLRAQNILI